MNTICSMEPNQLTMKMAGLFGKIVLWNRLLLCKTSYIHRGLQSRKELHSDSITRPATGSIIRTHITNQNRQTATHVGFGKPGWIQSCEPSFVLTWTELIADEQWPLRRQQGHNGETAEEEGVGDLKISLPLAGQILMMISYALSSPWRERKQSHKRPELILVAIKTARE